MPYAFGERVKLRASRTEALFYEASSCNGLMPLSEAWRQSRRHYGPRTEFDKCQMLTCPIGASLGQELRSNQVTSLLHRAFSGELTRVP